MIVVGDVAIAPGDQFDFEGFNRLLRDDCWCLNLEGAVTRDRKWVPSWGTCNSPSWRSSFSNFNLGPVFLGNNHVHDLPNGISETLADCSRNGQSVFGAGETQIDAQRAVRVRARGENYTLLGFGWDVIGCVSARHRRPGVNRFEREHALALAARMLKSADNARVICIVHGNYEFEPFPQPGHRRLAMELIDLGVYSVIFHHPHIVGPIERYRGRTIAYSVGNWAFSYGKFFGGKLRFPEASFHQIAIELGRDGDRVHHARFEPPNTVRYERTERILAPEFSLRAEFEGFDDKAYLEWFRVNRKKRKGLPIYRDATDSTANRIRDRWVTLRQIFIDAAVKTGLKSMRRAEPR